ncbi:hypothetical protein [Bradyrhizobium japonicum]|uniref:hypothetical protein n=1 Tax=Bradyrhizobium japonicum TaxID=375 RepID=UPI001B8A451D|nr:hypothetical protein [Bradyrhizobium japonicum]MBR0975578.1 hypothetical protein [Bradyrhizobium japonicum]
MSDDDDSTFLDFAMPQPLSRVRPKANVLSTPNAIVERPKLAPLALQVVARWAEIEMLSAALLGFLLHTEADPIMAMLQTVRSASAQMDMIAAAGAKKLTDPELETFEAVISMAKKAAHKRHPVAHHIWAYCEELPDAVLLIEPAASLQTFVEISKSLHRTSTLDAGNPLFEADKRRIMVYREKDFLDILSEMKTVSNCIGHTINLLHGHHPVPHQIYGLLYNEPSFVDAVLAIRKHRPQPPEPD